MRQEAARTVAADCALVACSFLWGLGFVAMKNALSVYPTYWLLFFRFGVGALLMGLCFARRVLRGFVTGTSRRDLVGGVVMGVFLFLGMGIQTLGLNYTSAGKQAFLTASYVVLVPLVLWGLRRVFPGVRVLGASLVCFAGMGLLTSDLSGPLNVGDVLTVTSAFFFAGQIISTGHYAADGDPLVLTFIQFCVTAALALCAAFIFDGPLVPRGKEGLGAIAFCTFCCTFLGFLVQNVAQKITPPTHASILLGLESVFGLLSGIVLLGEPFTLRIGAGCSLIFGAVLLVEVFPALFPAPSAQVSPSRSR